MIQSMTGYGKVELNFPTSNFTIELRSLNSKQIDVSIKMPAVYREKEINLRKFIAEELQRGKIELSIWQEKKGSSPNYTLNIKVLQDYYQQINNLKKKLGIKWNIWTTTPFQAKSTDIIPSLLKMPDVIQKGEEDIDITEWEEIKKGVYSATRDLMKFRKTEGGQLAKDITERVNNISQALEEILPFDEIRKNNIKEKLNEKLNALLEIDQNRLEQELIYYLEKQDITEEQVRLKIHLAYFIENMKEANPVGKKLGFIAQEIGREINTIGAKASNADIQKIIVRMKDELEKIKEQVMNIL